MGSFSTVPDNTAIQPTEPGTPSVCKWRIHFPKIAIAHRIVPRIFARDVLHSPIPQPNHIETVVNQKPWHRAWRHRRHLSRAGAPLRNQPGTRGSRLRSKFPVRTRPTTDRPGMRMPSFWISGSVMAGPAYISGRLTYLTISGSAWGIDDFNCDPDSIPSFAGDGILIILITALGILPDQAINNSIHSSAE